MIVTKKHFGSYLYQSLNDELFTKMHLFAKKMGLILDKALGFDRCMQVMEGFDVDHAHLKLFPVRVGNRPSLDAEDVRANDEELSKIAEKIRKIVWPSDVRVCVMHYVYARKHSLWTGL